MLLNALLWYHDLFTAYPLVLIGLCGLLGLIIGSFLNVVALRVPRQESFVYPPSHCMHCQHQLRSFDLIPLFSYLLLRGRCRYCRERISPLYPAGEALCSVLFMLVAWRFGLAPELFVGMFFVSILTAVTLTDLRYGLIPDKIVAFGLVIGLLFRVPIHPLPLLHHMLGMLAGAGVLYAIAWLSWLCLKREGMGGGDIKLFGFIGFMLGTELTLITLFAASLFGSVCGWLLLRFGGWDRERTLPFGPFIALGAVFSYLWGSDCMDAYLNFVRS